MNALTRVAEHPRDEWIPSLTRLRRSPQITGGPNPARSSIATHSPEICDGHHIQAIFGSFFVWPNETEFWYGIEGRGEENGAKRTLLPERQPLAGDQEHDRRAVALFMSGSDRLLDCPRCRRTATRQKANDDPSGTQGKARSPRERYDPESWAKNYGPRIMRRLALDRRARRARGRQLAMELVVWVSPSRSTCARTRATRPST